LAYVHYRRGEAEAGHDAAAEGMALAERHGLAFQSSLQVILRGWARVKLRDLGGIEDIENGLSTLTKIGVVPTNVFLAASAAAYAEAGRRQEALALLTESPIRASDPMSSAELTWIEGELRSGLGDLTNAEACYDKAVEFARGQKAKSWELKAAMSLARLQAKQGKKVEAQAMLLDIYSWFKEGLDTADLKEARLLLEEGQR
jgi:predicted ATPase